MTKSIGVTAKILGILKKLARPRRYRDEEELKKVYRSHFDSVPGDIILMDLAERFHLGTPIKDDDFMNGERNVVLYMLTMIYGPIEHSHTKEQGQPPAERDARLNREQAARH